MSVYLFLPFENLLPTITAFEFVFFENIFVIVLTLAVSKFVKSMVFNFSLWPNIACIVVAADVSKLETSNDSILSQ